MAVQPQKMSPQDESMYYKVKIELKINPRTSAYAKDLKLQVRRGIVTLEGRVPAEVDSKAVERVVYGIAEVTGVVNNLTVGN
jgi:osmotically-inducible protein OsmY